MRNIEANVISDAVRRLCMEANYHLGDDVLDQLVDDIGFTRLAAAFYLNYFFYRQTISKIVQGSAKFPW